MSKSNSIYRQDFPIFQTHPELIYLDSAATTQKPLEVIDSISNFYKTSYANIHRGIYELSLESTQKYEAVREQVRAWIGASSSQEIIFCKNSTEGLNILAAGLGSQLNEGESILISEAEHHANLVPWQQIALKRKLNLRFVKINERGELDLENLQQLLTPEVKIVALNHSSNVLGNINPIQQIKKIITKQGSEALFVLDASQTVAHLPLNVQDLGCDFLTFSSHKTYGPSGVGVLWGRKELLLSLPPYQTGGDMIKMVTETESTWNDLPWKFEAGTPNIEGVIGLGAALSYLEKIGWTKISEHLTTLFLQLKDQLEELDKVNLLGDPNPLSGLISFTVEGVHPHDLSSMLDENHICIRAGQQCAGPLHHFLDLAASNRVSLGIYNDDRDTDQFIKTLKKILKNF